MIDNNNDILKLINRSKTKIERVALLFQYLKEMGKSNYDESVTQYEHAVQTAYIATQERANNELVVAALFHDIGHLLADEHNADDSFLNVDLSHELVAADYLHRFFPKAVIDPIQLHVPAKRYLCTKNSTYYSTLSEASKKSFQLQGGFMTAEEVAQFEMEPHAKQAVMLRKWDDLAKISNKKVPGIESYAEIVTSIILAPIT